ncbi:uncharacterized protein LOC113169562 [Anabas testudineus]|uniref:uncharacterized protein LOC113169562 n=1 Tax=Anabas testudineus TaxID=64144 RepID=UPI000E45A64F|nr:uncharacterized protein LOC113169562 [Anabas testudineus]
MDSSDTAPQRPGNNSCFTKMKKRPPIKQVMLWKTCNLHRLLQVVQRVVQKSCRRACQLFCCPTRAALSDKPAGCPAQDDRPTAAKTTQVALTNPPSTILIVNISNSTLIGCVIGNEAYSSAVAESQPLMQESALHMHDQMRCSCSWGQQGAEQMPSPPPPPPVCPLLSSQEPPRINIHSSHLNYVIIGDNNYMHAEHAPVTETEEPQM